MDLRSGGMGGGNKEAPVYTPPEKWTPRIILSNAQGVSVTVFESISTQTDDKPSFLDTDVWIPPETNI